MNRKDRRLIIENTEIYRHYRDRLMNLALSRYHWDGLPEGTNRWYMEKVALENGSVAMLKPKDVGDEDYWLTLGYIPITKSDSKLSLEVAGRFLKNPTDTLVNRYSTNAQRDVYGNPTAIRGIGANGEQIETEEWEIFHDNMTRKSTVAQIDLYAKLLWTHHQVQMQNVRGQSVPFFIATDSNRLLTFKNIMNRVLGFEPTIYVSDKTDLDSIKTLDIQPNYIAGDLELLIEKTWARALSMLGISSGSDKRERLVTEEAAMSRQEDLISANVGLMNRREFCENMNEKYGLNMSVNMSDQDLSIGLPEEVNPYVRKNRYDNSSSGDTGTEQATE